MVVKNPLRPEELPEDQIKLFDFDSQIYIQGNGRKDLVITRYCPICSTPFPMEVRGIRVSLTTGKTIVKRCPECFRLPINVVSEKACARCGIVKKAKYFRVDNSHTDGLRSVCKDCDKIPLEKKYTHYPKSDDENLKWCGGCKDFLPLEDFHKNKLRPSGLDSRCRNCGKDRRLMNLYGISLEEYNSRLKAQNNSCAICHLKETEIDPRSGMIKFLHVDHDHACCPGVKSCGKCLRGLLCSRCNTAIGQFNDNKRLLIKAIQYIQEWE
jgi:hypothetical protein